ncbi:hypothetical protein [Actinoplanes sp. NPDC089786]|uniref:hypothetical protein n=1 Tax=Actinoplanes sp. NPDC089786 TaxID=3155185 RepID=UPI00341C68B8
MIRLSDLTVVFQPKPDLRIDSFIGALQAMIRTQTGETGETGWRVTPLTGEVSFTEWRDHIDLVTRVRLRLTRPGPGTTESGLVASIAESGSDLATVELRAAEGLKASAPLVNELARLAEEGYGEFAAKGIAGEAFGAVREWNSNLRGETIITDVEVEAESGEASWKTLDAQLADVRSAPSAGAA